MLTIFRKELADHFSSTRFLIIFCLITMIALVTSYMVGSGIKEFLSDSTKPKYVFLMLFTTQGHLFSLIEFVALFGPLIGLIMGFDAINRERNTGTLSKLISQPIYRDAVINGKFLAGVTTISIMLVSLVLLISGLGLLTVGVVPGLEEVARLFVYLIISIAYVSFWLGLSILFSIFFRSVATSALAAMALWIFFLFFPTFGANLVANVLAPIDNVENVEQVLKHNKVARVTQLVSPVTLYSESTSIILNPLRRTMETEKRIFVGLYTKISMERFKGPLPLDQSVLVVVPYLMLILGLTVICFGVSYLAFMRQEIRSV